MAMAPEKAGIGIRRHFTAPGEDPYAALAWELRDARITNYRDGSVAFEQRDVEFPVSWSQNATNIVAQKYFRGQLGSPERERSLRQVADRVVDTITEWGRKDGYFTDDEEAEAFRAELKHLVVHQKAAFNSPVWFNIGVAGEPQQASACQPWHALVSTPEGLVPIGELVDHGAVGAKVFDAHGLTSVVAVKANGTKTVLRVRTVEGYSLDVTADHLVWRVHPDGTAGRWVAAGELRPGDQLEWHHTDSWGDGQITRQGVAEAALAGWVQAGGYIVDVDGKGVAGGEVTVSGEAEEQWFRKALADALPGMHATERSAGAGSAAVQGRRLHLDGSGLAAFVKRWGLHRQGIEASVPEALYTAPLPVAAAYLRSLFQAEGWVSSTGAVVGLAMASEHVVRGVQSLLLRFGIFSRVRRVAERRAGGNDFWVLNVTVATDGHRFADEIGFVDPGPARDLDAALAKVGQGAGPKAAAAAAPAVRLVEVEAIGVLGDLPVYDIQTESGEYLSGNLRVHNCFILAVEDTMRSILNWYVEEGTIFKGGSGAGINLSSIRSSKETLKGGGGASGPVSFMRGADASAGTIKSGGKTRRAAKMVILNADHPDVEDFIWCKAIEERKARVLRDAGFDMDLDGKDSHSTQYQNANNSVRVTDEFMQAVVEGRDWKLRAVTTGDAVRTLPARDLFRQIAEATWECADPGMQFDTTINRWHTASNTGRINGSNPCFPGDQLVHTDKGLIRFDELFDRARQGETFGIYTHDATSAAAPAPRVEVTRPEAFMVTGWNEIVRLRFDNGMELRCTPNHALFTLNRGWVAASDLTAEDEVKVLDLPAAATGADRRLPVSTDVTTYQVKGDWARAVSLPEKWSAELAHYLGWLIGDGCIAGDTVTTVYGSAEDQEHVLPKHLALVTELNGGRAPKPSAQANGTVQLRQSRRVIARFLEALGVTCAKAADKVVPWSVEQAPSDVVGSFLRGLFDADGCVYEGSESRYEVSLGSASEPLLRGVQRLLTTLGISSRIYTTKQASEGAFVQVGADGSVAMYDSRAMHSLRVAPASMPAFAEHVGFDLPHKARRLASIVGGHRFRARTPVARLAARVDDGVELTYNLCEPRNHSYLVQGLVVRNCSEYMHLDNSACNLASLNLLKFLDGDGRFDVEGFKQAVEVVFTAQEILVGNADYPTEKIAENSRRFRQLGLGYANLGALLMALGLPYDSDQGRAWAASITSLMTGHAYATSGRIASRMGPFAGYEENAEPTNRVLGMHRDASRQIDGQLVPLELLSAAHDAWDTAVELSEWFGVRNSQASVLAPTGCLVGGSLVATDRGLVRLRSLGDPDGAQWQDLDITVATDDGPRRATQFYVNGAEAVVTAEASRGYRIQGTPTHRVRVVDPTSGLWVWRRFAELQPGDLVPLALDQIVGGPAEVALPPLPEAYWTGEHHVSVPRNMTAELAELVGYFMGDGSLHSRGLRGPNAEVGLRFCVAKGDFDVVERLERLGKEVFGIAARVTPRQGYDEVAFSSVRLVQWWEACGFAKHAPSEGHSGKGWRPHIPDAVLHANDREVYGAFVRGVFEADGTVTSGYPCWSTTSPQFAHDVQTLLLALGFPTTRRTDLHRTGRGTSPLTVLRLLNTGYAQRWLDEVGFMGGRKQAAVATGDGRQAARHDHVPLTRAMVDRLAPANDRLRRVLLMEVARGAVSRRAATELYERTQDPELGRLLRFFYDRIQSAELGEDELTYDLSVPANVTYVANGFVSHNTIGLMMDCDTTGIEPDLGLCKTKKLVGGGTMSIVNQTVPRALRRMGYTADQVADIVAYIDEHKSILGAPHLSAEHLPVFACSMGDNVIHYLGHVKMMGAVQPFISGAISKCVAGDTLIASADGLVRIGSLHDGEAPDTFRPEVREVASLGGEAKTDAFYYGGVKPVWEIVLRSGHRLVGTSNHRVLVATPAGLDWRRLDEIERGEYVATQQGSELWSVLPARFDDFRPSVPYGAQKPVTVPPEMSEELAFLLGAYAAEGHTVRSTWTIVVTNADEGVLDRVATAWRQLFGLQPRIVRQPGRCPGVVVSSKTVVEFLEHLGSGSRASDKRIPDAVLRSPRDMVLAFLQGLSLDAHTTVATAPKWGICLDSPRLLDDLQAVLTNLGIRHGRVGKRNQTNGKTYDEVYATGEQAQRLLSLVPFPEVGKAERAKALMERSFQARDTADVVPGMAPADLYRLIPEGSGLRSELSFLCDPRTVHVTRRSLERVAALPGVVVPPWLQTVLDDDLHFSPVEHARFAGEREVFDLSVPTTHAFVGNGIVNHNTINMPEQVTVEEVEQLHLDAWRLGIKAVAIYRDNCKVAQPLSTTKKDGAAAAAAAALTAPAEQLAAVVVREPVREKLPRRRSSKTFSFRVADCHGYVTVGEYDDGRPGEIFLKVAKQGSTLAGIMDAFAISVSHGLQYGVPLKAFIDMYTNMRFEPAGMTDDPDIRFASSLVDYIFRRLAVEYLPLEERTELGILTVGERMQPTLPGVEESVTPSSTGSDIVPDPARAAPVAAAAPSPAPATPAAASPQAAASDAPYCYQCGMVMQRAGACFVCSSCGTTSGCS